MKRPTFFHGVIVAAVLAYTASTRHSATFDEIVLVSGGVRGLEHGAWDMHWPSTQITLRTDGNSSSGWKRARHKDAVWR